MSSKFNNLLFLFFQDCYKQQQFPQSWKVSFTIFLHKIGNVTYLNNHIPIALANTIYKLYTSKLTTMPYAHGKRHQILYNSQEGFRT
jgi:hypothetical protein